MSKRKQPFGFSFSDSALAEAGGVPLDALHRDVEAICRAADAIAAVAQRLGVPPPKPHLAGFAYPHVSTLGCQIVFPPDSEPKPVPILRTPEDIDRLAEPQDYLSSGVVPERLRTLEKLLQRRPDAVVHIGHPFEGPATTAALLMGREFFTLPFDDPQRAHKLLRFCTESAVRYARAIHARLGRPLQPGPRGIPDDFAGMFGPRQFAEFVVPYWDRLYCGLEATERHLHSELLRVEHLRFLADLKIAVFDPSADQYLTPESLRKHCPVPFTGRILSWHVHDNTAAELQAMYRRIASFEPVAISLAMERLSEEEKLRAVLEVARELAN